MTNEIKACAYVNLSLIAVNTVKLTLRSNFCVDLYFEFSIADYQLVSL